MKKRATTLGLAVVALSVLLAWLAMRDAPDARASAAAAASSLAHETAPHQLTQPVESASKRDAPTVALDESVPPDLAVDHGLEPAVREPTLITLFGYVRAPESRMQLAGELGVSATDRFGKQQRSAVSPDGAYSISGLAPGLYWIRAGSTSEGSARARVEFMANEGEHRLDLQLVLPPEIRVKAVDRTGAPLNDIWALPVATLTPPGEWFEDVLGAISNPLGVGRFLNNGLASERLPDVYLGKLILDVEPPVYVSLLHYQRVVATQRVERGQTEVEFVIDRQSTLVQPGSVRFRFVDASDGTLLVDGSAQFDAYATRMLKPTEGEYRVVNEAPGWHEIIAHVKGYERAQRRVLVQPGIENDFGDLRLEREVWIAGVVTDASGAGIASSVRFSLFDESTGKAVRHFSGSGVRTTADGKFKIPGLSRASYVVRVHHEDSSWGLASRLIDVRSGPVADVRFELVPGVPLVVRPSGEVWRDVRYKIADANEQLVTTGRLFSEEPYALLLAPGRYEVEVRVSEAGEPKLIPVTIASAPVELALP